MIPFVLAVAFGQDLALDGVVPDDGLDHFFVDFDVPAGTAEVQVHLDDQSESVILDWGVNDPNGHRGWGGGNTEPAIIGEFASSRSYTTGAIDPGTWQVVVGKARVDEPASYHLELFFRSTATLAAEPERSPYEASAPLSTEARWYKGDFHVHSIESGDARASLDEIAVFAAGRGLDFVVITDHNIVSHLEWFTDVQARHPDLLFIPGAEFTTYDGHANAIGATSWVDHKIGQPGVTIPAAIDAFHDQGALFSINHPSLDLATCIGCDWGHADADPGSVDAVEIATGGWDESSALFTPAALVFYDDLVSQGSKAAVLGGSDDHRAGVDLGFFQSPIASPTTQVFAAELSVEGILAGIRAKHTFVQLQGPDDPTLALTTDGEDVDDGTVKAMGELTVTATVSAGEGNELVWIREGVVFDTVDVDADPFSATTTVFVGDVAPIRAELRAGAEPLVVTSYLFPVVLEEEAVTSGDTDAGKEGCGCGHGAAMGWWLPIRRRE